MARILIVEDEDRIAAFLAKGLSADGHQVSTVADGPGGTRGGAERRLRPDGARHRSADHRRLRGARPAARPGLPDAGGRADRPRLGARHRLRARGRRRRLPGQAVPLRRAAGPDQRTPAAAGQHRRRGGRARSGSVALDLRTRRAAGRRRESDLSAREFALAEVLLRHPGQVLSARSCSTWPGAWTSTPAPTSSTSTSATCAEARLGPGRDRPRHGLPLPALISAHGTAEGPASAGPSAAGMEKGQSIRRPPSEARGSRSSAGETASAISAGAGRSPAAGARHASMTLTTSGGVRLGRSPGPETSCG